MRERLTWCVNFVFRGLNSKIGIYYFNCMGEREAGMFRKRTYGGSYAGGAPAAKRYSKARTVNSKVVALQKKVALLSPEVKSFFISISEANITAAAGRIFRLSNIVQGLTDVNRVGDKVRVLNIKLSIDAGQFFATVGGSPTSYRVAIVKDLMSNGVLPTISGAVTSIYNSFTPFNQQMVQKVTRNRFKVLKQWYVDSNQLAGGTRSWTIPMNIPCNFVQSYLSSAGTIADADKNQLYLVITTNDGASTLDIGGLAEISFTDV